MWSTGIAVWKYLTVVKRQLYKNIDFIFWYDWTVYHYILGNNTVQKNPLIVHPDGQPIAIIKWGYQLREEAILKKVPKDLK